MKKFFSSIFDWSSQSSEYRAFVKKYGADYRYYCEDGFKMKEKFMSPKATATQKYLINSQDCKGQKDGTFK